MHGNERLGPLVDCGREWRAPGRPCRFRFRLAAKWRPAFPRTEGDVQRLPHRRILSFQIDFRNHRPDAVLQVVHARLEAPQPNHTNPGPLRISWGVNGFGKKSTAPRRIASTAISMVANAVITTISSPGANRSNWGSRSNPCSCPRRRSRNAASYKPCANKLLSLRAVARFRHLMLHRLQREPDRFSQMGIVINQQQFMPRLSEEDSSFEMAHGVPSNEIAAIPLSPEPVEFPVRRTGSHRRQSRSHCILPYDVYELQHRREFGKRSDVVAIARRIVHSAMPIPSAMPIHPEFRRQIAVQPFSKAGTAVASPANTTTLNAGNIL